MSYSFQKSNDKVMRIILIILKIFMLIIINLYQLSIFIDVRVLQLPPNPPDPFYTAENLSRLIFNSISNSIGDDRQRW